MATDQTNQLVQAMADAIVTADSDYSHGKPGQLDFVREAARAGNFPEHEELHEIIADEMFDDAGVNLSTEHQMAAFILARLQGSTTGTAFKLAAPWTAEGPTS